MPAVYVTSSSVRVKKRKPFLLLMSADGPDTPVTCCQIVCPAWQPASYGDLTAAATGRIVLSITAKPLWKPWRSASSTQWKYRSAATRFGSQAYRDATAAWYVAWIASVTVFQFSELKYPGCGVGTCQPSSS